MLVKHFQKFVKLESSAGILLFLMALLAIILNNSGFQDVYQALFDAVLTLHLGVVVLSKPLLLWVNDGLMAIFFFLVGLEVKRELIEGELNSLSKIILPAAAAVGGMLVPALVYWFFAKGDSVALRGWAIPTATDIAFSLGILSLLGSRIPNSLKIFLTALAIFDDIGAIVVIAVFYTSRISYLVLFVALGLIMLLWLLNRCKVTRLLPYLLVGFVLWVCVLKSGVHATLAGVVLAFAIPIRDPKNASASPLKSLEHRLHPWVAYGVLPLFAFANAGIYFGNLSWSELYNPIVLGIAAGLFIGKQVGITGASWLAIRLGLAKLPTGSRYWGVYGLSLLAGVGFTMSLFIGTLAFGRMGDTYHDLVRMGVILGSLASGLLGYFILRYTRIRSSDGVEIEA